jgi:hypothetical protein
MSNYLRGLGRAVGFLDETEHQGTPGDLENDWDNISRASSYGEANLLRGATIQGPGPQITGGDCMIQQGGGEGPAISDTRIHWEETDDR